MEEEIKINHLPKHLAIIMDGNGRWAKKRGFLRTLGHENGVKTVKTVVKNCAKLGIEYLTLYTFSTENWNRPKLEVDTLMKLLANGLQKELKTFLDNNIRFNAIGNIHNLPLSVKNKIIEVMEATKHNTGMTLSLALSYGAREEIVSATKKIAQQVKEEQLSIEEISETIFENNLYTYNIPNVDLVIRTSGEQRISNFLLWQIAYAELYFTDVLWPDFEEKDLLEALKSYQKRERRFGKTSEQL